MMKEKPFFHDSDREEGSHEIDFRLEEILRSDEIPLLSPSFAERVTCRAIRIMKFRQLLKEWAAVTAAIILPFIVLVVLFFFSDIKIRREWIDMIVPLKGILTGALIMLLFVLFADRVLLPWLFWSCRSDSDKSLS